MRRIPVIIVLLVLLLSCFAGWGQATTSYLFPSNNSQSGNGTDWSNRNRIYSDDNSYASVSLNNGSQSKSLIGSDFNFSIPTFATVVGIEVVIGKSQGNNDAITDYSVKLVKGGNITGGNYSKSGTWSTAETASVYGGSSDLWGTTWTPANINATDFGVAIAVSSGKNNSDAYIDYIKVRVTYSLPSGSYCTPTYSSTPSQYGDFISYVGLESISNSTSYSTTYPYYTFYSSLSTDLYRGFSYTITIEPGYYSIDNDIAAWIDFNADGTFSSTEKLGADLSLNAGETGTMTFTVPATAAIGTTRLRVREVYNVSNIDPCNNYDYGETEDYLVNILSCTTPSAPTATGASICIGSTQSYTLSASGASSGDRYVWYSAASGGTVLQTSTSNTYTTPAISAATNYWVSILASGGCESTRTQVSVVYPSASTDSQASSGSDTWFGHVYKRLDSAASAPNDANAFSSTNYYGHLTEAENFDESYSGDATCFSVLSGAGSNSVYSEYFAVRYRMTSSKTGIYLADVGSDDGVRLSVDGTQVYTQWVERAYATDSKVLFQLSGSSNLILDYYESTGQNRTVFSLYTKVPNALTSTTDVSYCQNATASVVTANNAQTDIPISSATGYTVTYQWQSSADGSSSWTNISGATSQNYTPLTTTAGTTYYRRKVTVSRTNPGMSAATTASDTNSGVIKVGVNPNIVTKPITIQ